MKLYLLYFEVIFNPPSWLLCRYLCIDFFRTFKFNYVNHPVDVSYFLLFSICSLFFLGYCYFYYFVPLCFNSHIGLPLYLNVLIEIISFLYSSSLFWILYEVSMHQGMTQCPHIPFLIAVQRYLFRYMTPTFW